MTSLSIPFSAYPRSRDQRLGIVWIITVACAHIFVIWVLWSLASVPRVAEPVALLWVSLTMPAKAEVRPAQPVPQVAAAAAQAHPRTAAAPAAPVASLNVPRAESAPVAEAKALPAQATAAAVPEITAASVPISTPEPAPAAAPPPRRQLPPSAVQYRVLPPVELPRAARRAGESGTVWLRVLVDAAGLPAQVTVQRSSGFARLDEQALWAMRQARFKPHTEDGRAVEVEVIAPIEYPAA